jgi:hypothetical protein
MIDPDYTHILGLAFRLEVTEPRSTMIACFLRDVLHADFLKPSIFQQGYQGIGKVQTEKKSHLQQSY